MTLINTNVVASGHTEREEVLLPVAVRHSKTPEVNLTFIRGNEKITHSAQGETAFLGGIFCLEDPSRRSEKVNFHFANYRFSFRKLQILSSQTTDFHFANYRFSFRKLQIFISQTTDFHFANYRFSFRFVPFCFVPFRFAFNLFLAPYFCISVFFSKSLPDLLKIPSAQNNTAPSFFSAILCAKGHAKPIRGNTKQLTDKLN